MASIPIPIKLLVNSSLDLSLKFYFIPTIFILRESYIAIRAAEIQLLKNQNHTLGQPAKYAVHEAIYSPA